MKINLSMDSLRPMVGTMKKYSTLLPSVIITVVALLLFLPMMMVGKKVSEKMESSARTAGSVQSLVRNVPSRSEAEQWQANMDKFAEQVEQIKESAIQASRRDLITYDYVIFPEPVDPSSQIYTEYGQKYRNAVEALIERMNALDAPSDSEIGSLTGGARRTAMSMTAARQSVDVQDPMVDGLLNARSQEITTYANPAVFKWYTFWDDYEFSGKDQALMDCWDSQVAFWIYDDIVDTIQKMNGTTSKVVTAPVKRLLGVSFTGPVVVEGGSRRSYGRYPTGMTGAAGRDIPNYIVTMSMGNQMAGSGAAISLPSNFIDQSPTGRSGGENIDVVHFAVSVVVDNRFILSFMKELCSEKLHVFYPSIFEEPFTKQGQPVQARHNQISILQSDLKVVDKTASEHELYRYGKGAVMQLDLICEYLFDRAGYDAIKPKPIKERLGQPTDDADETQSQPGGKPGMPMDF